MSKCKSCGRFARWHLLAGGREMLASGHGSSILQDTGASFSQKLRVELCVDFVSSH